MPELIDKSKLIADIWDDLAQLKGAHCTAEDAAKYLDDLVRKQPTIEPEVRHGRWIPVTNGRGGHECNQCHNYAQSYQTGKEHLSDYCPNCGAKMDGGAENASA